VPAPGWGLPGLRSLAWDDAASPGKSVDSARVCDSGCGAGGMSVNAELDRMLAVLGPGTPALMPEKWIAPARCVWITG